MTKSLKIVEQGYIETPYDFMKLNLVDWERSSNPQQAMNSISSWFLCTSYYTILEVNLLDYPERNDFPGWQHIGDHEETGKAYWNFFHHHKKGTLDFSDSPDFSGSFVTSNNKETKFYGDIGKVSPIGMRSAISRMEAFDNWITIVNYKKQVIIQPFMDIYRLREMTDEEFLLNLAPYVKYPQKLFNPLERKQKQSIETQRSLWD